MSTNDDQQHVRQPCHEDLAGRVLSCQLDRDRLVAFEAHDLFGFHSFSTSTMTPMQVSELMMSVSSGPDVIRDEKLHAGERDAAREDGGQHLHAFLRPDHHDHQVAGNDHGKHGAEPADHRAQRQQRQAGDVGEGRTGVPMDPKATGAVLASRQMPAA